MEKQVEELYEKSFETLNEKKSINKSISAAAKDIMKLSSEIERSQVSRCKDYLSLKGKGWAGGPLELNTEEKRKDKISQVFIKLKEIYTDCEALGITDILDEYQSALLKYGIQIKFDIGDPLVSDPDEARRLLDVMANLKNDAEALTLKIREEDAAEAEELGVSKKSLYPQLLSFYEKKMNGKDVEDAIQDKLEEAATLEKRLCEIQDIE